MITRTLHRTYRRYRTLQTDRISSLPVVILMPHSACNCRCVMCDIWKGNSRLQQLTEEDLKGLLDALKKYGTEQVLMSGGEALLHRDFFRFCEILKSRGIKISLLSTGLLLKKHAAQIAEYTDDVIISLDGDEGLHDAIRNIPGAFTKLREGIEAIREIDSHFPISGRTVIHRLNFRQWPDIIKAAKEIRLDRISFLPADVSSTAFNRATAWDKDRQHEIALEKNDLPELQLILDDIISDKEGFIRDRFIAESPQKLQDIYGHYAAISGLGDYPAKKCNAPWVSAVIEADGDVRPCFFHASYGNIKNDSLDNILNSPQALSFRKNLDMNKNNTCVQCVCHLYLSPTARIG